MYRVSQSAVARLSRAVFRFPYIRTASNTSIRDSYRTWYWYQGTRLFTCRPLRETCSVYPPASQPFSARNCRQGILCWGMGNPPEVLCFLCFLWRSFFVFLPFFVFSLFRFSSYEYCYTFSFLCPKKVVFHLFFSIVFSVQVPRGQG